MKYISAEEFLEQSKKVQQVFLDWWEPQIGDLFVWNYSDERENDLHKLQCCTSKSVTNLTKCNKGLKEGNRIPLLTEGQLRSFISDISNRYVDLHYVDIDTDKYIVIADKTYITECIEPLQAYWKVAIKIAKELTT